MPKAHVIVDGVSSLSVPTQTSTAKPTPAAGAFTAVQFQGGQSGLLDMRIPRSAVWAEVLDSLRQANEPAYVEIDPKSNEITQLLCPLRVRVAAMTPSPNGDFMVELSVSHARHFLRRSSPDFQQLLTALQSAQGKGALVLVTETLDGHEIIDVRPPPRPFAAAAIAAAPPVMAAAAVAAVTPARVQQMYDLVNAQSCSPLAAPAPCIPFLFPDDGCWGRAHEMCRLIIAAGEQPEKIWIYGNLLAATRNNPSCQVRWVWHVAPTLMVTTDRGSEIQVIDPSLFTGPVSQATWVGVQGDPLAAVVPTSAAVFLRTVAGLVSYDDAVYTQTRLVLDTYRRQLRLRSAQPGGPPPYAQCP